MRYEAAGNLVTLFSAPTELISRENDNKIIQKMVMEILPVLSSSDLEVRREALGLVMSRNIEEIVLISKRKSARHMQVSKFKIPNSFRRSIF